MVSELWARCCFSANLHGVLQDFNCKEDSRELQARWLLQIEVQAGELLDKTLAHPLIDCSVDIAGPLM